MQIQEQEQRLNEKKNEIGLVGGTLKLKQYDEIEHNVSAHIDPQGWNIEISVKKGFEPIKDRRQKAYAKKKKIQEGLETMLSDISLHEFTHWQVPVDSGKGCPYDPYYHDKILEAVKQTLPVNKREHASYVANAFEDTIINPRAKEWQGDFSGQVLFWDWEGISCKENGQKHYAPFYEAFVKLNMHLFGDNLDRALLKRHYSNVKNINEAVEETINQLNLPENIKDTSVLFNKQNWPKMARTFTKNLADLLEEKPTERLSAFSSDGESSEGDENQSSGNPIEQKSRTEDGKEEIAYKRYTSGDKQSTNLTSHKQLYNVYKRLARAIPVQIETITRKQNLQISPLTYRAFDKEKDFPSKIKLSKLFLTDKGLEFAYPDKPLIVSSKSKVQKRSFPDFKMIILDNSGTMAQAPDNSNNIGSTTFIPWGDNSKYHYALLGFAGVESFLQSQGIAQYIDHGLSLFSSQTRYEEANFFNLNKIWKHALSPDWGSTNLEASVLINALKGRESFMLSISDGQIHNWSSEKNKFKELAQKNYYAHIQLGSKTNFTKDLESWNLPVFYVNTGEDLSKLMVDITTNTYHKFTRGENK